MTKGNTCHVRQVFISKDVRRGTVELPPGFFVEAGMEPGHTVVVEYGNKRLKARSSLNDLVKGAEVVIAPKLAILLGVKGGETICVEDRSTVGDEIFDEVDDVLVVLETKAVRAVEFLRWDLQDVVDETVDEVLDMILEERAKGFPKDYIEVEPDLADVAASEPEEPTPPIDEQVKVWTPDPDGDGTVPVFKPEQDEDED